MPENPKASLLSMAFSRGFGQAVFFPGSEKHRPRFRSAGTFLSEEGKALSVSIPPKCFEHVAFIFLGDNRICSVKDDPKHGRRYIFTTSITDNMVGDTSLLLAQVSAMVHETIAAEVTHNPDNYTGTVPLGVQ